jgi:predicted transcriptional regulator
MNCYKPLALVVRLLLVLLAPIVPEVYLGMVIQTNDSIKDRIFLYIKENPGILRTEVRDQMKLQNNVSGPAIKELIDRGMVMEGHIRVSKTTNKPGRSLYVAEDWQKEMDAQYRIFE